MNTILAWGLVGFLTAALLGGFIEMRVEDYFVGAVEAARYLGGR
jgi:hypothetical protein